MGLGGGKGRGGGGKSGKGGKGGKGLGGMLGGLPMVGGMFRPGGMMSGFPGMGGGKMGGKGGYPGMMGSSMMNAMNMFPGMMGQMFNQGMRGMGPMPWDGQLQQQGQGQSNSPFSGNMFSPPGQNPSSGGPIHVDFGNPSPQPQQQGNTPALGTPSGGSGAPGQFALPRSQGYTNTDYGFSPDRGPQRTFGGFTGSPQAGGNKQMGFYDPRVNR
jgi:hypothetical protein